MVSIGIGWLIYTPPGILSKLDAIGYAVCHQISTRSFHMHDHQFPLCARCTGMYLGAITAIVYQLTRGKKAGFPSKKILVILAIFALFFVIDGSNSYLHFFPQAPHLYTSQNWLRLLTGGGIGLGIGAMVLPIFRQTMWANWNPEPVISTWKDVFILVGALLLIVAITLFEFDWILYPFAFITIGTVLLVLGMVYTLVWTMLLKMENQYRSIREAWFPLFMGLGVAILQIFLLDVARFALTGTWQGFSL